jgi:4-hydroxy-tetrahydrodipicolinate reductase
VLHLVASAIGLRLDDVQETHEILRADDDFEIASGPIAKGTISGMRFEIIGLSGGEERIVVEHVTRLRDDDAPEWPQGRGYRVLVEGEPHLRIDLELDSDVGDHNHAGCLATAMHVVNAIPHVVAAEPGIVTMLDLPVYSATWAQPSR